VSKYAEYDAKLLNLIQGGCDSFGSIAARMHKDSTPFAKPSEEFRVTDRRLQALRKDGRIAFDKSARKWRLLGDFA
jgi:hypothetical protein